MQKKKCLDIIYKPDYKELKTRQSLGVPIARSYSIRYSGPTSKAYSRGTVPLLSRHHAR